MGKEGTQGLANLENANSELQRMQDTLKDLRWGMENTYIEGQKRLYEIAEQGLKNEAKEMGLDSSTADASAIFRAKRFSPDEWEKIKTGQRKGIDPELAARGRYRDRVPAAPGLPATGRDIVENEGAAVALAAAGTLTPDILGLRTIFTLGVGHGAESLISSWKGAGTTSAEEKEIFKKKREELINKTKENVGGAVSAGIERIGKDDKTVTAIANGLGGVLTKSLTKLVSSDTFVTSVAVRVEQILLG